MKELRKCVLLCCRCHAEIHAGVREIPSDAARFDEKYADYKAVEREMREASWLPCPKCGRKVPPHKKYCSYKCSGGQNNKVHWRVDWDSVDLASLYPRLSKRAIAAKLGVSDQTVAKHLQVADLC